MTIEPSGEYRESYHDLVRWDVIPYIPKSGGQLLDVGGGVGATAFALRENGVADKVGVVDMVSHENSAIKLDYAFQGNLEDPALLKRIKAERGTFQTILALDILEHLVDPWKIITGLEDLLAPKGYLVASIPNIRNYQALMPLFLRNSWNYQDAGILDRTHLRFFVRETAESLISNAGLKITNVVGSPTGGRKVRLFRQITFGLLNSFTDRQYVIVGQKSDG
ncbi:MAG: methyltransferase domain-containing protein [Sphingorhabdus sp.]